MTTPQPLGSLLLVHWDEFEARDLAAALLALGWEVRRWEESLKLSALRQHPPTAVVISLRRLPSHGRQVADALWYTQWGQKIPIVFFDGAPHKVNATRQIMPAAHFTTWEALPNLLNHIATQGGQDGPVL